MGKIVVVAEKPSVARDIARVLRARERAEGMLYNDAYVVTWAVGHLVALAEPDELDEAYKRWDDKHLPIPPIFKLKTLPKTKKQFSIIKKLINAKDTDSLICATDSGREGELIFRYLYEMAGCKKPFTRLWVSSMTDSALQEGLKNVKDGHAYDALYESARCRSRADWLVGMNATRAYTVHGHALLSVGRVQTPTLALLVRRQAEIDDFRPQVFYEVVADFEGYRGKWIADITVKKTRIDDKEQAEAICRRTTGKAGQVVSVEEKTQKSAPPLLYDLTSLQREANRRFGFTAKKTLSLAQALYEKHKLLTYPRTDSRFLTHDLVPKLAGLIQRLCVEPYAPYAQALLALEKLPVTGRIVNDKQVRDHHAIIPTDRVVVLERLTADERKIHDLVARRFLAAFYPSAQDAICEIVTLVGEDNFFTRARREVVRGWREVEWTGKADKPDDEDDMMQEAVPAVLVGQRVANHGVTVREGTTRPPAPHTEASLLAVMEHAGKTIGDEALREELKDRGLGTPATRAAIIERLIAVGYVVRSGKSLLPTDKAKQLIALLPDEITSAETTGKWERALARIAQGEMQSDAFMDSIVRFCDFLVDHARHIDVRFAREPRPAKRAPSRKSGAAGTAKPRRARLGKCPLCGQGVFENSKGFYCAAWRKGCQFTVWKNALAKSDGPQITPAHMKAMLSGGQAEAPGGQLMMEQGRVRFEKKEND